mmetsp:Transcript_36407/g.84722  ORF Transcript_36407/g.84722 Transcript_36407/m.84722 type:complete len:207 (+) Transcript_36407:276-896(+)
MRGVGCVTILTSLGSGAPSTTAISGLIAICRPATCCSQRSAPSRWWHLWHSQRCQGREHCFQDSWRQVHHCKQHASTRGHAIDPEMHRRQGFIEVTIHLLHVHRQLHVPGRMVPNDFHKEAAQLGTLFIQHRDASLYKGHEVTASCDATHCGGFASFRCLHGIVVAIPASPTVVARTVLSALAFLDPPTTAPAVAAPGKLLPHWCR